LIIEDKSEQKLFHLIEHEFRNGGVYQKKIRTKKFDGGVYSVKLTFDGEVIREKLVVAR